MSERTGKYRDQTLAPPPLSPHDDLPPPSLTQDERTGKYRDQSANLREFTSAHELPPELIDSLQDHLRLHFDTSEVWKSDRGVEE